MIVIRFIILFFMLGVFALAETLNIENSSGIYDNFQYQMYEDKTSTLKIEDILKISNFTKVSNNITTGFSSSNFWFKVKVVNKTDKEVKYLFEVSEGFLHEAHLYILSNSGEIKEYKNGLSVYYKDRVINNPNPLFPIELKKGESKTLYLKIFGLFPNYTATRILDETSLDNSKLAKTELLGLYFGAGVALLLYNLFIFFSIREKIYLYYVAYVFSFISWQLLLNAYPPFSKFETVEMYYSLSAFIPLWLGFLMFFSKEILETKKLFPKLDKIIFTFGILFIIFAISTQFEIYYTFTALDALASLSLPVLVISGFMSYRAGNKTAFFYLIAQLIFITMSTTFSLMTQGYLPYNTITRYGIVVGSFIEIILFSLALAYRIKLLRDEKLHIEQKAKAELELKVKERTEELTKTLNKLIQSEKMAALGQLVANVAHEINTPLGAINSSIDNFSNALNKTLMEFPKIFKILNENELVLFLNLIDNSTTISTKNIYLTTREKREIKKFIEIKLKELNIDSAKIFADYFLKLGIESKNIDKYTPLLKHNEAKVIFDIAQKLTLMQSSTNTIKEAIKRASKVVFALKSYVRVDHNNEKRDIYLKDSIESVLTLYNNQIKKNILLIKDFHELKEIACYEDIGQVWNNLIHNALQAMNYEGKLKIELKENPTHQIVSIIDSGKGISDNIKDKIFEPFFTTKAMGEGSGLGLDIVKKIIDKHNGYIEFESELNEGTTFKIYLPKEMS